MVFCLHYVVGVLAGLLCSVFYSCKIFVKSMRMIQSGTSLQSEDLCGTQAWLCIAVGRGRLKSPRLRSNRVSAMICIV